jgi:hypothetical protein
MLVHSILGGPYTTGGGQEQVVSGGKVTTTYPIFRVCLATPDNGISGLPLSSHGCSGTPSATASTAAWSGGASDVATLAAFLGV